MADSELIRHSKFLSLVLRHDPEKIGLILDEHGWAEIEELLQKAQSHGRQLTRELVARIVAENDKQRFAISADGVRIRANQGHSIEIDLAVAPTEPPATLFHGTARHAIDSIRRTGLDRRQRQHVHLSRDVVTATKVGQRHGVPAVLTVRAGDMHAAGHQFYLSANGVWLTDHVPAKFIIFAVD